MSDCTYAAFSMEIYCYFKLSHTNHIIDKKSKVQSPNVFSNKRGKFEKNKTNKQLISQNKLRENLFPKISVRTSKLVVWISRC